MESSVHISKKGKSSSNVNVEISQNIYSMSQIVKKIKLHITLINKNISQTIEKKIGSMVEGKCIVEGYVKPKSVKIISFTSGVVMSDCVLYDVVFQCDICYPVAGMLINCTAINITKAGIRAESQNETPSPFVVYISRDQYFENTYFNSIKEKDALIVRIIAQRFELNDTFISIIAEVVAPKKQRKTPVLIL